MYHEAWRIQRDFFYDPELHGLDLKAAIKKYEPYLDTSRTAPISTYLFQEMLGNMTVGHHSTSGGELPQPAEVSVGLLGCDYKIENGRYRFAKVYSGENWNSATARAAHAAGRERQGGRIPARRQRPRTDGD